MITEERMDELAHECLLSDTEAYVLARGVEFEAMGHACGELARAMCEAAGFDFLEPTAGRVLYLEQLGPQVTTAVMCGFELALRCAEDQGQRIVLAAVEAAEDAA